MPKSKNEYYEMQFRNYHQYNSIITICISINLIFSLNAITSFGCSNRYNVLKIAYLDDLRGVVVLEVDLVVLPEVLPMFSFNIYISKF